MKHSVVGDSVILGIAALHGIEDAADSRLLVQDVVELEGNGESISLEERLRQLGIPQQFVSVHRSIVITTTALHTHIR